MDDSDEEIANDMADRIAKRLCDLANDDDGSVDDTLTREDRDRYLRMECLRMVVGYTSAADRLDQANAMYRWVVGAED